MRNSTIDFKKEVVTLGKEIATWEQFLKRYDETFQKLQDAFFLPRGMTSFLYR